jgi:GAF domain-containing protein
MDPAALHKQLVDLAPGVDSGHDLAAVEAHASSGCSRCARALVNAQDTILAFAEAAPSPGAAPSPSFRERVLAAARGRLGARREIGEVPRRFFDPAGEVARLHVGAPGDAERTREVDELAVSAPAPDDASGRFLAQIQGLLGFPLLFVSVVRGPRVGYRVQIGLDGAGKDRRRETTFCTHAVATGEPMVVPNAAVEPFFRGSVMVLREGIKSYVGVPLRTSRGVIVGNVCAMDYVPRRIGPSMVRLLELYAEPIVAEIERARFPAAAWPRTAQGTPIHPEPWFRELLKLAAGPLAVEAPGGPLFMAVAPGREAHTVAALARPDEPVGQLAGGAAYRPSCAGPGAAYRPSCAGPGAIGLLVRGASRVAALNGKAGLTGGEDFHNYFR